LQPNIAIGEGYVQHMISYSMEDGGLGKEDAILGMRERIEALDLEKSFASSAQKRAQTANKLGIELLRDGRVAEAVETFETAYQATPNDAEVINNFGYAHLLNQNPEAAEPLLLQALVFDPGRANAWANLGQSYANRERASEAIACFALAYRFSSDRNVTREFLQRLALDDHQNVGDVARQTLALDLIQAEQD
jgi:Flp pilus assembly protein TadD